MWWLLLLRCHLKKVFRQFPNDGRELSHSTGTVVGMGLRKDHGIVLRGYPFGDADRVVVILSPNHGKLRTVAKGVRKTKSRFGGRLEPFTHVELGLYEGRNLDTITSVSVLEAFPRLREDLDRVMKGGSMLEAADAIAVEGEGSHRLFLLVQRGLRALNAENSHPDLVASFLLKAAEVVGVAPSLLQCASCGKAWRSRVLLIRRRWCTLSVVWSVRCSPIEARTHPIPGGPRRGSFRGTASPGWGFV